MKYIHCSMIVLLSVTSALCTMDSNQQYFIKNCSLMNFDSLVIRTQDYENIMDDELIEAIESRRYAMQEELRGKKISIPKILLVLKISQEVIAGAIRVVEVYKEEKVQAEKQKSDKK